MSCLSFNKLPGGSSVLDDRPPNPLPSLTPSTSYTDIAPNYLPFPPPTSSLFADSNSQFSLTPPSSASSSFSPSTTNSDGQSSTLPTLPLFPPQSRPPTPMPNSGLEFGLGFSVKEVGPEYERLVALYDEMMIGEATSEHRRKPETQRELRQQEKLERNREAEEQTPWEAEVYMRRVGESHADIGAEMLRGWVAAGNPRGEVTESMRQRQRDEVALLASRFGVYYGWAGNRYGLLGRPSEASIPGCEVTGKLRGWTGW